VAGVRRVIAEALGCDDLVVRIAGAPEGLNVAECDSPAQVLRLQPLRLQKIFCQRLEHVAARAREHLEKRRDRANAGGVAETDLARGIGLGNLAGRRVDAQRLTRADDTVAERIFDHQIVVLQRLGRRAEPGNGKWRQDAQFKNAHTILIMRQAPVRTLSASAYSENSWAADASRLASAFAYSIRSWFLVLRASARRSVVALIRSR